MAKKEAAKQVTKAEEEKKRLKEEKLVNRLAELELAVSGAA